MYKTYKRTCYKGIVGDLATEWWTEDDWKKHSEYVEKLIADDTYGEAFEVELTMQHLPFWDDTPKTPAMESYRMVILDFNDKK